MRASAAEKAPVMSTCVGDEHACALIAEDRATRLDKLHHQETRTERQTGWHGETKTERRASPIEEATERRCLLEEGSRTTGHAKRNAAKGRRKQREDAAARNDGGEQMK
jgi:hypothetical protein